MKATPAKTLRARPDSQRPPEQQLRPRFYDSPTTRFDGSPASSNSYRSDRAALRKAFEWNLGTGTFGRPGFKRFAWYGRLRTRVA